MQPTQITLFNPKPKVKRVHESDTPTYRANRLGASSLSFTELLAVILNDAPNSMEIAEALVNCWPTPAQLAKAPLSDIERIHGMGAKRTARILAMLGFAARFHNGWEYERTTVHSPADAAQMILYAMSVLEQEELWLILLDTRNRLIEIVNLYRGSVNQSQVRVGELFREAVRRNAVSMIVAHNHPSGDPSPSPDDIALTRALVQAGKLMDIGVLDHLVIGGGRWVSLKERGLGFTN